MAEADLHLKLDRILAGQADAANAATETDEALAMLVRAVQELVPLLSTQREMLQKLLEAAGEEKPNDGELGKLLNRIAAALQQQTADLGLIRVTLQRLPGQVEAAAIDGIRLATGDGIDLPG